MVIRAQRFMRRYPTYEDFLVAIHDPNKHHGKDVLQEIADIVGEDDLVDVYFDPLRADNVRAGDYIFKTYKQVASLAHEH